MARTTIPKINWGTSFANTLNFGYPLDGAISWPEPRLGSEFRQAPSGIEDAWIVGNDYYLEGAMRWIPTANTTDPLATGWDGATGVSAFLAWARAKNQFRFYPDKDSGSYILSYLVAPMGGKPELGRDGTRTINLQIRSLTEYTGY
jgi:hypothetical protein